MTSASLAVALSHVFVTTFLDAVLDCVTFQMVCGHVLEQHTPEDPCSNTPCLRGGISTYTHTEMNCFVSLLSRLDVAMKTRFNSRPGNTCLIFLVWIDSHIFLLRGTFDSNADM